MKWNLSSKAKHNAYKSDVFSLGLCIVYMITHKKIRTERLFIDDDLQKEILEDTLQEC